MRWRWLLIAGLLGVAACVALVGAIEMLRTPARELAAARSRWAARPFSGYRLVVDTHGFGSCHYEVEIHDEQVTTIFQRSCLQPAPTVTDLFRAIEANMEGQRCGPNGCGCDGPLGVDAAFDTRLGYPLYFTVRPQPEQRWRYLDYWKRLMFSGCTEIGWPSQRMTIQSLTPLP